MKKEILFFAICVISVMGVFGQAGSPDNTFDSDGKVITEISSVGDQAFSVLVQPDGKIVVAGVSNNGTADFTLVRYKDDGSTDNSFGLNGITTTDIGTANDIARSIAIQPDGKIVAAGYSYNGANNDFALVRYNSDGSLDNSFGSGGITTTSIGEGDDYALSVVLQPDGEIVVGGYSYNGTNNDIALTRYHNTGSLDNSFGNGGIVTTDIGNDNNYAYSIALQADGKILAAGAALNGLNFDFAVVRYNIDGSIDNTFGIDGIQTTAIGPKSELANSVILQPDGKIIVGGYSSNGTDNDFAIVRYDSSGMPDPTFSNDGIQTTPIGTDYDYANGIALQADGKIIAAGDFNNGTDFDFAVVRFDSDGNIDNTFGMDGKVTTSIGTGYDYAYGLTIAPDGKILVAGSEESGAGSHFAVVRYLSDLSTGLLHFSSSPHQLMVYPNPVKEKAILKYALSTEENISIHLTDMSGLTLRSFESQQQLAGNHEQLIDLLGLPNGSYLVVLSKQDGDRLSVKIIK